MLAVAGGAALAVGGLQYASAGPPAPGAKPADRVMAAYAKAQNLSVEEARTRLVRQSELARTATKLDKTLKPSWSAGSWIDQKSGRLLVAVTNRQRAAAIDAANTESRLVTRSTNDLEAVKGSVDGFAKRHAPRGVAWYIDVPRNVVTVEVAKSLRGRPQTKAFLAEVRRLGAAVKVRSVKGKMAPNYGMQDGDEITSGNFSSCSLGWWVQDRSGADLLMTAGHCLDSGGHLWYHKLLHIGGSVSHKYGPMDWGTIHVDDIAAPRPTTQVNLYNGAYAKISGYGRAPVGTQICKSGHRTGQTCGPITAHDVTVTYGDGHTLTGMSKAALVDDHGDSGGAVYQFDPNKEGFVIAQGMVSGGTEGQGPGDIDYYQPIDTALADSDTIFIKSTE
ncbi:serine protease [Wenjunlia tyrosinilytica]|uniref:Serine protease n=2 Tax=Wenjunlia tyrosinilytica TaxID=1544741 RepID=A0A917ZUZ1_9ACTN|nr:serine protease [Wenjunlia tyrosinilytica]